MFCNWEWPVTCSLQSIQTAILLLTQRLLFRHFPIFMLYQILRTTLATQNLAKLPAQSGYLCTNSLFRQWGLILPMILNTIFGFLLIIVRLWNTNITPILQSISFFLLSLIFFLLRELWTLNSDFWSVWTWHFLYLNFLKLFSHQFNFFFLLFNF